MIGRVEITSRPVWRSRWAARLRSGLALLVIAILSAAGLRAAVTGPTEPPRVPLPAVPQDLEAEGFAETFARAYLTWDAAHPERHAQGVAPFASAVLESGAGLTVPRGTRQEVVWTAPVQDRRLADGRRLVTVAAQTTAELYYLSVPVGRDRNGFMFVSHYPALVGGPAANPRSQTRGEPEVEDPLLDAVARRAVTNYLARETSDLRADLAPTAVVSLPPAALEVRSVDRVVWAGPRRVAVELRAATGGAELTLRYELDVVKRERWYLRSIQVNPNSKGVT